MFISERIRLHKAINKSLQASRKVKTDALTQALEAMSRLRHLQRDLRSFNAKHPLFSKMVWIIDRHFAILPIKKEMARLKKIAINVPLPLPKPVVPPYFELLDLLQNRLYKQKGGIKEQIFIDLLHLIMQSTLSLHHISLAFRTAQVHQMLPDHPAVDNCYKAMIKISNALSPLMQMLKRLEEGEAPTAATQDLQRMALKRWNELKLPLFALKVLLENQPGTNPFEGIYKTVIAVENCLDEKVLKARRFLEAKVYKLRTNYKREKRHLAMVFPSYQELVKTTIRAQMRSYKKQIRLYAGAHIALNYSPQIAELPLSRLNKADALKEQDYLEFIQKCEDNSFNAANLFLPCASETLQQIREQGKVTIQYRREIHQVLKNAGVQAYIRLHTPLT